MMKRNGSFRAGVARRLTPLALVLVTGVVLAQSSSEDLKITLGRSIVVDYPVDVARISTSNPEIVDAVAVSTREILLHGKAMGVSTIVVWAKSGQRTFYNIAVEPNLEPIRRIINDTFPNETINVSAARDSLTLTGAVSSKDVSDRAAALAASMAKTVVNYLQTTPSPVEKQVLLRVKFAEVDRNVGRSFGTNLISTGFLNTPGTVSTGQFSPARPADLKGSIPGGLVGATSEFTLSDALNIFAFRPDLNLAATIQALRSEGVLQILAEPNLVTTVGKEASFLVGGEFPIPVLQGGGNAGAVTIQFREFGIRLTFNPQLTLHNTLKMYVKPEVSTIDLANSVRVSGFLIPALATRRMETNIELGRGQSFVIGGLVDDRVNEQLSKIPGLGNIPVLGAMFRSRQESKSRSELIVMVTPEIVDPLRPEDVKPMPVMPRQFLGPVQPSSMKTGEGAFKKNARNRKAGGKEDLVARVHLDGPLPVTPPEVSATGPAPAAAAETPAVQAVAVQAEKPASLEVRAEAAQATPEVASPTSGAEKPAEPSPNPAESAATAEPVEPAREGTALSEAGAPAEAGGRSSAAKDAEGAQSQEEEKK